MEKDGGAYEKGRAANVQVVFAFFSFVYCAVAVLFFLLFSFAGYMTAEWYKASDAVLAYSSLNGKSRICLPDSTFVWLNAGSTLEYFVSRWTKERNVRLDGEAYFEVAAIRTVFL